MLIAALWVLAWLGVSVFFSVVSPVSWWYGFMFYILGASTFSAAIHYMLTRWVIQRDEFLDEYDRMIAWCEERGYHPEDS